MVTLDGKLLKGEQGLCLLEGEHGRMFLLKGVVQRDASRYSDCHVKVYGELVFDQEAPTDIERVFMDVERVGLDSFEDRKTAARLMGIKGGSATCAKHGSSYMAEIGRRGAAKSNLRFKADVDKSR
jgi:general stress protein YciG